MSDSVTGPASDPEQLRAAIASGDPAVAMPALAGLRDLPAPEAIPLLLLGLQQTTFLIRSLACAGLGIKRSEEALQALIERLRRDADANVRAEAANAIAHYGVERAWPLLREAFAADREWLVRCSILSAVAEDPAMPAAWLLELARLAVVDADGTVRVGAAEILGRLLRQGQEPEAGEARELLRSLRGDADHRVVAAVLDALQL